MICSIILTFSTVATPALADTHQGFFHVAVSQEEVPTIADEIDAYKKLFKKSKGGEDEAIGAMDSFLQHYLSHGERIQSIDDELELKPAKTRDLRKEKKALEKEREDLVDAVWYSFAKRKRITEDNLRMWKAAAYVFGQMGEMGADYLVKAFDEKRFSKEPDVLALFVKQIGYTHDYSKTDFLLDLLDHHHYVLIANSAEALTQFRDAPGKIRHEAVKVLVRTLESYRNAASDNEDTNAQRKFRQTRDPMMNALTALAGVSQRDSLSWTKWWNANKKDKEIWAD